MLRRLGRYRMPIRKRGGGEGPVRFDLDPESFGVKAEEKRADVLGQGLASRQADPGRGIFCPEAQDFLGDLFDGYLTAPAPSLIGVAETAPEIAAGQADEDRRLALAQALALDRGE